MTIGEKILNLRKARGWSQEELAERVGVTRQAVSRWESGAAKPDADKIVAICDLFGVSADYLLRDIAAGTERETLPCSGVGEKKNAIPWFSWAMAAFGGVTLFILGILASVNRTYVSPVHEMNMETGAVTIVSSGYYTGFSDYVSSYGLEWLAWLAGMALVLGGGHLLLRWYRRIWKENMEG